MGGTLDDITNPYATDAPNQGASYNYATSQNSSQIRTSTNPLGLILGILSIFFCPLTFCCVIFFPFGITMGIIAWVVSRNEKQKIDAGILAPNGITNAGYILGIVGTFLNLLVLLLGVAYLVLSIMLQAKNGGNNF